MGSLEYLSFNSYSRNFNRSYSEEIESMDGMGINSNYALVFGAIILIISMLVLGILTERILYYLNEDFRNWKDNRTKIKNTKGSTTAR